MIYNTYSLYRHTDLFGSGSIRFYALRERTLVCSGRLAWAPDISNLGRRRCPDVVGILQEDRYLGSRTENSKILHYGHDLERFSKAIQAPGCTGSSPVKPFPREPP